LFVVNTAYVNGGEAGCEIMAMETSGERERNSDGGRRENLTERRKEY
jgi:hypothetical protein